MKKDRLVNFRTNDEDIAVMEKAAKKLSSETGEKPNFSKAVRHSINEYATAEPEMFHCNITGIQETEMHCQYGREYLQRVVNEFHKVTNHLLTFDQLKNMLIGMNSLGSLGILKEAIEQTAISLIYADQKQRYKDLNFSIDQVKVPDTSTVLDIATSVNFPWIQTFDRPIFWNTYNIVDGKITVSQAEVEKICSPYRMYATTSEERAKLSEVKKLCRMLDGFVKNVSSPGRLDIPGLCYFDRFSQRFEPSHNYIKNQL